jgi:hypothetical protein
MSDTFIMKKRLKEGDALSSVLLKFDSELGNK